MQRQSPEKILQQMQVDARKQKYGKLKIYLGAAPGVGKTYEMLIDAYEETKKGLDLVIGVAESHGRADIDILISKFEILPKKTIEYHGKLLEEFDIDAALNRKASVIIMDEMAHSNVEGLRHFKRWQDIKELLTRGINVYTTLNVQHIESLNDSVAQIIHAPIKETVPDLMIDMADTIELVDLPPETLLKRLQEGKIYIDCQIQLAADNYFKLGNLIALRELALRITAGHVNAQVLTYRQGQGITQIWPIKEKILVCVGPGPEAFKLIREARKLATSLQTQWIAIYVNTAKNGFPEELRNNAIQNLRFAEQLGAETRILSGIDVVHEIMNFARSQNVTQIMVWKYIYTRRRDLLFRNIADELVRSSGEINVYIMTGTKTALRGRAPSSSLDTKSWRVYVYACSITFVASIINYFLSPFVAPLNLIMIYLLGNIIVGFFERMSASILTAIMSLVIYCCFFIPAIYPLNAKSIENIFTFIIMLILIEIISYLGMIIRRQTIIARLTEQHTSVMYKLSRQLARTRGEDQLLETGVRYIAQTFDEAVMALVPENNLLIVKARFKTEELLDDKEQSIAQWVYDLGQPAGLGTDTLATAKAIYLPLIGSQKTIGVLRIRPLVEKRLLSPEEIHLLETCANQVALAVEVERSSQRSTLSQFKQNKSHNRSVLLELIAHAFRAPLSSIMLVGAQQIEAEDKLNVRDRKKLGGAIVFEAEELTHLINNFLQISHFESNGIILKKKLCFIKDLVEASVKAAAIKLAGRVVNIHIDDNLPAVFVDIKLIEDVLSNLLDNAIKSTLDKTTIDISVSIKAGNLLLSVEDYGIGINLDETEKLFKKFYQSRNTKSERGLGLGLAICKYIIKAHTGKIWAENKPDSGAVFRFTLPLH